MNNCQLRLWTAFTSGGNPVPPLTLSAWRSSRWPILVSLLKSVIWYSWNVIRSFERKIQLPSLITIFKKASKFQLPYYFTVRDHYKNSIIHLEAFSLKNKKEYKQGGSVISREQTGEVRACEHIPGKQMERVLFLFLLKPQFSADHLMVC